MERANWFRRRLLNWSEGNLRSFPWRETQSPYRILVSEVLLQQTLAKKVENVYFQFFEDYPTPEALADASSDDVAAIIKTCGLQNRKAPALVKIGRRIADEGFPRTIEELTELPFVSDYAANATLCFAFDERRPIVDTNVVRIFNRFFGVEFEDDRDDGVWEFAEELLPETRYQRFNLALLDFGATICVSDNPRCTDCPVNESCTYFDDLD